MTIDGFTEFFNFNCDMCGLVEQGRGIAVYVRDGIKAHEVACYGPYRDQLWLRLVFENQDVLIGVIYRSPSLSLEDTVPEIIFALAEATKENPPYLIVCGDFNIKHIDWKLERCLPGATPPTAAFLQGVQDCMLFQHIFECTRFREGQNPQVLDLVFSNDESIIDDISFLPGLDLSDHLSIHFSVACEGNKRKNSKDQKFRNWNKADYRVIEEKLRDSNLEEEIKDMNVQEAWDTISKTLEHIIDTEVPLFNCKKKLKSYKTYAALALRRRK